MRAPAFVPSRLPPAVPHLRLVKATLRAQEHATPSISRKVWLTLAIGAVGVGLLFLLLARGEQDTDPEQGWFWKPDWLAGEFEADRQIAAGQVTHYDSDEAFIQGLADRTKPE